MVPGPECRGGGTAAAAPEPAHETGRRRLPSHLRRRDRDPRRAARVRRQRAQGVRPRRRRRALAREALRAPGASGARDPQGKKSEEKEQEGGDAAAAAATRGNGSGGLPPREGEEERGGPLLQPVPRLRGLELPQPGMVRTVRALGVRTRRHRRPPRAAGADAPLRVCVPVAGGA